MFFVSSCSCLCPIYWSQVLSREWRCSWSSANGRCSNYIWVINNFIIPPASTKLKGGYTGFTLSVWWWWVLWLCWITMVVGSGSFNASHRRSTGLLLLWWWAAVVSMLHKITFIIVTEDRLYYLKINCIIGTWKTNCCVGRSTIIPKSTVLMEDQLRCWKINGIIRRSAVLKTMNQIRWRLLIKENNCKKMTT